MKMAITSILVLCTMGAVLFSQLPLNDVPANHWAYEGVKYLLEAGIIGGMPDGTFQGNVTSTRYQLAVSLHRAIEYMKATLPFLKAEDVAGFLNQLIALNSLVDSLSRGIEGLGERHQILDNEVKKLLKDTKDEFDRLRPIVIEIEKMLRSMDRDLETAKGDIAQVKRSIEQIEPQLRVINEGIGRNEDELRRLRSEVEHLSNREIPELRSQVQRAEQQLGGVNVRDLQNEVDQIAREVASLKTEKDNTEQRLTKVEDQLRDTDKRVDTVDASVTSLENEINELEIKSGELRSNFETLRTDYEQFKGDMIPRVSKNSTDIMGNSRQIEELRLKMGEMHQDLQAQMQMPTIVSWVGLVAGAIGIGVGVYALFYAEALNKKVDEM